MNPGKPGLLRDANGRFAPGGSGRPHGARGKVSRRVARTILADFEAHQHEVLPRLRQWFLPQYVALLARLMPKPGEADGGLGEGLDGAKTVRLIEAARAAFARIDAGEGTLADLEAALAGAADPNLLPLREKVAGEGPPDEGSRRRG